MLATIHLELDKADYQTIMNLIHAHNFEDLNHFTKAALDYYVQEGF